MINALPWVQALLHALGVAKPAKRASRFATPFVEQRAGEWAPWLLLEQDPRAWVLMNELRAQQERRLQGPPHTGIDPGMLRYPMDPLDTFHERLRALSEALGEPRTFLRPPGYLVDPGIYHELDPEAGSREIDI